MSADHESVWERAMRRTLAEDIRYRDPAALDRRIEVLRQRRHAADPVKVHNDKADRVIALLNEAEQLSKELGITDSERFDGLRYWAECAKEIGPIEALEEKA